MNGDWLVSGLEKQSINQSLVC